MLGRVLRGDLDWIVMKALEKDRARRYETANALAMDVERFLADEEVSATPPSTARRVWRLTATGVDSRSMARDLAKERAPASSVERGLSPIFGSYEGRRTIPPISSRS